MWNFVFEDLSEIIFRNQVLNFEYINSSKTKELRNLIKFIKRNLLQLFYSCMTFVRKFQIKSQFNSFNLVSDILHRCQRIFLPIL